MQQHKPKSANGNNEQTISGKIVYEQAGGNKLNIKSATVTIPQFIINQVAKEAEQMILIIIDNSTQNIEDQIVLTLGKFFANMKLRDTKARRLNQTIFKIADACGKTTLYQNGKEWLNLLKDIKQIAKAKTPTKTISEIIKNETNQCQKMEVLIFVITDNTNYKLEEFQELNEYLKDEGFQCEIVFQVAVLSLNEGLQAGDNEVDKVYQALANISFLEQIKPCYGLSQAYQLFDKSLTQINNCLVLDYQGCASQALNGQSEHDNNWIAKKNIIIDSEFVLKQIQQENILITLLGSFCRVNTKNLKFEFEQEQEPSIQPQEEQKNDFIETERDKIQYNSISQPFGIKESPELLKLTYTPMPFHALQKDTQFITNQDHEMFYANQLVGITNSNIKNQGGYMKNYSLIAISCITSNLTFNPQATCERVMHYIKQNVPSYSQLRGEIKIHETQIVNQIYEDMSLVVSKMWFYWGNAKINDFIENYEVQITPNNEDIQVENNMMNQHNPPPQIPISPHQIVNAPPISDKAQAFTNLYNSLPYLLEDSLDFTLRRSGQTEQQIIDWIIQQAEIAIESQAQQFRIIVLKDNKATLTKVIQKIKLHQIEEIARLGVTHPVKQTCIQYFRHHTSDGRTEISNVGTLYIRKQQE